MEQTATNQAWGGHFKKFKVTSVKSLGGLEANLAVYLPPAAEKKKVPVLYYLAGMYCAALSNKLSSFAGPYIPMLNKSAHTYDTFWWMIGTRPRIEADNSAMNFVI